MAFPPKKSKNIVGQGAIVRSLRKPRSAPKAKACGCAPGESCPECAHPAMDPANRNC